MDRSRRRPPPPFLAPLLLALAACAHGAGAGPRSECSLADGAPWAEYQSRHFVIDAAGWEGDPGRLVAAMEDLHAAVLGALVAEPVEIPGRVRVIVLPSRREVEELAGGVGGVFWATSLGEPTILVGADDVGDLPQVVAHELAHHVSFYLFPRQASWFAEGLAQFVEGVAKVDREGRRWAGLDPVNGWYAGSIDMRNVASLVEHGGGYGAAWVLYRFLWNEHGRALADYQRRLWDGASPREAWDAAFPQWSITGDKAMGLYGPISYYQRHGRGARWEVKLGPVDHGYLARPASRADVHLALLDLQVERRSRFTREQLRRQLLAEALREDPGHPLAAARLAELEARPPGPVLQATVAGHPGDGRGHYLLAQTLENPAEREAELRQAVELWPDGALAHAALARELAAAGRPQEALAAADRAVELAPWSPQAVATLAAVAGQLGRCRAALVLQQRAVEAVQAQRVGSIGLDLGAFERDLAALEARCPATPPAAAAAPATR